MRENIFQFSHVWRRRFGFLSALLVHTGRFIGSSPTAVIPSANACSKKESAAIGLKAGESERRWRNAPIDEQRSEDSSPKPWRCSNPGISAANARTRRLGR